MLQRVVNGMAKLSYFRIDIDEREMISCLVVLFVCRNKPLYSVIWLERSQGMESKEDALVLFFCIHRWDISRPTLQPRNA